MGLEIEHRFLLRKLPTDLEKVPFKHIKQGYLDFNPAHTVRVRIADGKAFHTTKGLRLNGVASEDEYEIPLQEAEALMASCNPDHIVEKLRYEYLEADGHIWELDIFQGKLHGLAIAEVELLDEHEKYLKPVWLSGPNITNLPDFSNASLATKTRNQVIKMVQATLSTYPESLPSPAIS